MRIFRKILLDLIAPLYCSMTKPRNRQSRILAVVVLELKNGCHTHCP